MPTLSAETRPLAAGASPRRQDTECEERIEAALADLAHDIRQPLSRLECSAYLLRGMISPGETRAHMELERLYEEIVRAQETVDRAVCVLRELRRHRGRTVAVSAENLSLTNPASGAVTY